MPRIKHPETGKFVKNLTVENDASDGSPRKQLFLPCLPPPWTPRWYRKRGRYYVDASRGRLNGRDVRLCRRPETIVQAVKTLEAEIQQHGQLARNLTSAQRWMAAECYLKCARLGVELIDIVREYEKTHPLGPNAKTLSQVRDAVVALKAKTGRSERHVFSLRYRLTKLIDGIGDKPITAITTKDLEDELDRHPGWSPPTVHGVTQGWKIAFNFAIRRGWLTKNPADQLDLPKIIHDEPCCLTVFQAKQLLAATLFHDRHPLLPSCRAYLAIGMFAGIRPEEMSRLKWGQVDLGTSTITIKAENAKARVRRIVDISPNLRAWLAPLVRRNGNVLPQPLDQLRAAARTVLNIPRWPADILRHTFASYHYAAHRNEALTKHQMGHRDDGRILHNHYCVPIHPEHARLFWGIVPPAALLMSG
jgi:integrase/recombinase XerD